MRESQPVHESARRLVLVADNEPAMTLVIARVLAKLDLVPVVVDSGAAAIASVETRHNKLCGAILDITMPGVDGIDAAHAIQRIAPELAIVLMSSLEPAEYAARITSLRLAGMLVKPFSLAELRALMRHSFSGAAGAKPVDMADTQSKHNVESSYG